MWANPDALNRLSHWLLLVAAIYALLVAGRGLGEAWLPFKRVDILGAQHAETRTEAARIVRTLSGSFFGMDLEAARQGFEALPWVRSVTLRKVWPDRLVVELAEHVPAAAWNGQAMLNTHGEVFPVRPVAGLPRIYAPEGMALEVSRRYGEFSRALAPLGLRLEGVQVSPRHAWRLQIEDGLVLELGRDRLDERMRRFVAAYPRVLAQMGPVAQVDLRYPNGFAVSMATRGGRGKPPAAASEEHRAGFEGRA